MNRPLIAGGGPAGSAAAITLARSGARPVIFERAREAGDPLCGGFLSWKTLAALETLGIAQDELGGHCIGHLRLFAGQNTAEVPLPGAAMGISRFKLDRLLLARAASEGAGIERGITVRGLERDSLLLSDGARYTGDALFLATGKHDVPGRSRMRPADPALGLRVRLAAHPALSCLIGSGIELHLFRGGYAGLVLQEDSSANLCMAVRKSRLTEAGGEPHALLDQLANSNPALGERLGFSSATPGIDAIGAVPYGWLRREAECAQFWLGDQAGCIPSLAGEGNGIAIASGIAAALAWVNGGSVAASAWQADFARRLAGPMSMAMLVWRLSEIRAAGRIAIGAMSAFPGLAGSLAMQTRIRD